MSQSSRISHTITPSLRAGGAFVRLGLDLGQGYAQETGLPAEVLPWESGGTYKADDLRTFGGIVYRCIQPHTNYDPGHTPNLTPSLWAPQG